MGSLQLTSKLAFQNIMNYLRLLLFFFVLLAPLQLTSAGSDRVDCYRACRRGQLSIDCKLVHPLWGCHREGCQYYCSSLTMTTAITTAMTMATTKQLHQDFSKIICDFRV